MRLLSLNVGIPRQILVQDKRVTTGIFKEPVTGPVMLRKVNLDGDQQADLSVHGGADKAVYAYPSEHYAYWRKELPDMDLPWGMFGENFTTEGLDAEAVRIGDRFAIGKAEVIATQPRLPCFKLGIKFGRADMVKRFLQSRRTGLYFSVAKEGVVEAGDEIRLVGQDQHEVTIADITRLYAFERDDLSTMQRTIQIEALPESWKEYFREQLEKQTT